MVTSQEELFVTRQRPAASATRRAPCTPNEQLAAVDEARQLIDGAFLGGAVQ
jgi:hypothetical protein